MKHLTYFLLLVAVVANGQTVDIEKTYDVSKEAQKGFIQDINIDSVNSHINVLYRVRAKKDQMKFVNYKFNYNFDFIDQSEEIVDLKNMTSHKYKPAKYRGEEFDVVGLSVDPNMMGTLVLKKKRVQYSWNWFQLGYRLNTTVEGKIKATTDDDKKFFYWSHIEDNSDGTAMMLVGEKGAIKKGEAYNHMKNYHVLKYDINLNKLADVTINFEYPVAVVDTYGQPELEEEKRTDFIAIFATHKAKNYTGPKIWGPDPTEYTYVRVSYDGKLLDRITFNSPSSIWRIDDYIFGPDGEVFIVGPASDSKDDYYQSKMSYQDEKTRWPHFQVAKFHQGKLQYITATSIEEMKSKLRVQPDGKKGDSYSGRRIKFSENGVNPYTKELFIGGQNYSMIRNGKGQITGFGYEDMILLHFDQQGKLMSQWVMNKVNRSTGLNKHYFEFGKDNKSLYWTFFDNIDSKPVRELDVVMDKILSMPKMAKVNLIDGSFQKYSEYGNKENFAHTTGVLRYLKFKDTNQVNYFGENKKGSSLWFIRVNLDK